MPAPDGRRLDRTLTLGPAVGLAIGLVVGSGLLVLPGLAYQRSGGAAIYAWLVDALLVVPLLVVFARLAARYPSAGGVAAFVETAFGRRAAAAVEVLLLGTFVFGGPAMALTGGYSLAAAVGGGGATALGGALALLALAFVVNARGAQISGRVQQVLAYGMVLLLGAAAVGALVAGGREGAGVSPPAAWAASLPALGLVFWAYAGWEMLAFTAEEYVNPARDFPRAVAISFGVVVLLYLGVAAAVQVTLPPDAPRLATASVAALFGTVYGGWGGTFAALVGVVMVAANLVAGTFAASRLVFASARAGLLPAALARLDPATGAPRASVAANVGVFAALACAGAAGLAGLDTMLEVAGRNFLVLYGLGVAAYLRLVPSGGGRLVGLVALVLVLAMAATFGAGLLYPAALLAAGLLLAGRRPLVRPRD
ncbi:MAG TPA: amino acid permease [Thermodesulfobacteriota bacterium]